MDTGFQLLPHFFDTPQSWGEQVLDKKGNNVLDRDVNHELTRRTQFSDTQFRAGGEGDDREWDGWIALS